MVIKLVKFRMAGISDSMNDGIGIALDIFFQGCNLKCNGCHNIELQDRNNGIECDTNDIIKIADSIFYDSIVFMGGEPLEQQESLFDMISRIDKPKILYTGWLYNDIPNKIKNLVNIIIDGRYIEELKTYDFPASSNQRVFIEGELIENPSDFRRRI